jgi:hydroxyacylglutathione hydrolase
MIQITESLFLLPGQDEMIPDSHMYLIGPMDCGDLSLVDAGLVGKGAYKLRSLFEQGIKPDDIKRVIMTHTHLDHIGCVEELRQGLPSAELWVHAAEASSLEEGDERTVYGMAMFKQMCQNQYGLKDGMFKLKVDRWLRGDEELNLGGELWKIVHIPGHSPGGIGLYNQLNGTLIPGDVVYADHAIGRFDLHGAKANQLADSLMKLADLSVRVLLPGHNRIMKDVPDGYILKTAKQWASYLR